MSIYEFDDLANAPLIIDAVYKSKSTLFGDGPLGKLLPKIGNQGGFRCVRRQDRSGQLAYIVLYTTGTEIDWPDSLDVETGVWRYFGDNRTPGKSLHDTSAKGNLYLSEIFAKIDSPTERADIPPFLIFQWAGNQFDAKFLGVAAPGNPNIPPDKELNAIWRSKKGSRFQNYEAYFSVLDTGREEISKEWLKLLISDHENSLSFAPTAWKQFIKFGRQGVKPLLSPRGSEIPNKEQQLPQDPSEIKLLQKIRDYYKDNPFDFELCSTKIVQMMDNNFGLFELTRPWRDGGRDAIGKYRVGNNHSPLLVEFALEAKCYSMDNSVGVKPMSRLISRLRYRQFGVLVTTSYVHSQAYKEIVEDGHPVLIINAADIAKILRSQGINHHNVDVWLSQIGQNNIENEKVD
ncbi:MAG: restriction endonuclease [bacterium]